MGQRANEIGAAGEHVVCADLLLRGHRAMLAAATLPYDVVADFNGRLIRIAVKSTFAPVPRPSRPKSKHRYLFNVGRCQRLSTGQSVNRAYTGLDVDLIALVALDIRRVAYLRIDECPRCIWLEAETPQVKHTSGPRPTLIGGFPDYPLERLTNG